MQYCLDNCREKKTMTNLKLGVGPGFYSLMEQNSIGSYVVLDRDSQLWMVIPEATGVVLYPMKEVV